MIKICPTNVFARRFGWKYGSLKQVTVVEVYNILNGISYEHEIVENVMAEKLRCNWIGFQQNTLATLTFFKIYIDEVEGDKLAIVLTCGAFVTIDNTETQLVSKVYYPQNIPNTSLIICPQHKLEGRTIHSLTETLGYRNMSIYNNQYVCYISPASQDTCNLTHP
jgi:hypothetical protein